MLPSPEQLATMFSLASLQATSRVAARGQLMTPIEQDCFKVGVWAAVRQGQRLRGRGGHARWVQILHGARPEAGCTGARGWQTFKTDSAYAYHDAQLSSGPRTVGGVKRNDVLQARLLLLQDRHPPIAHDSKVLRGCYRESPGREGAKLDRARALVALEHRWFRSARALVRPLRSRCWP